MLATTQASQATATWYECEFDVGNRRDGNWVPKVLVVQHEDGAPTATVFDTLIQHYVGKPIEGRLSDGSKVRTAFAWDLDMESRTKQDVRMSYTFTYFENGRPAKVTARPAGFDNQFSGEGTCKVRHG